MILFAYAKVVFLNIVLKMYLCIYESDFLFRWLFCFFSRYTAGSCYFRLYVEAETQQRNIFKDEIQIGSEVIERINWVLQGDTLICKIQPLYKRRFFKIFQNISSIRLRNKVGVVKAVLNLKIKYNSPADTIYFDTTYRSSGRIKYGKWKPILMCCRMKISVRKVNIEKVFNEMDSATIQLLNRDFLNRIIKEALIDENLVAVRLCSI